MKTFSLLIAWLKKLISPTKGEPVPSSGSPSSPDIPFWGFIVAEVKNSFPTIDPYIIAAQIKAESNFRAMAKRKEPNGVVSYGLMQITDRTFLEDIKVRHSTYFSGVTVDDLIIPSINIQAGVVYDKDMWDACHFAASDYDRVAFMLSAYNGGLGWVHRDRKKAESLGYNPSVWFNNVENCSDRAARNFDINRSYVEKILKWANEMKKA